MTDPPSGEARAPVAASQRDAPDAASGFGVDAIPVLTLAAERLDALADTADLMGDEAGAVRLRAEAQTRRMQAMDLLDD